jgi:hypothetical protein|uniref:Uncharacterized protein n=1 Tax=Phaeodactylum tricornutum TaxID=2850 RepID=A0A8J9THV3_PHATR
MAKPRRSSEKKSSKTVLAEDGISDNNIVARLAEEVEEPQPPVPSITKTIDDERRITPREVRRKRREELRSKSTGVGLSIDANDSKIVNRKIVFGDLDDELPDSVEKPVEVSVALEPSKNASAVVAATHDEKDAESDDNKVEEMKSNVAKAIEIEERNRERATARHAAAVQKPKRKRRKEVSQVHASDNSENFDESFFAELDEKREEDRQSRKKAKEELPKGRHITFVVSGDEPEARKPYPAAHNIEVVVLNDNDSGLKSPIPDSPTKSESGTLLLYSRSVLADGSDGISAKQLQKAKKSGRKDAGNIHWKRSRKMNRLLVPGARSQKARLMGGRPAAHFVVEM